MKKFVITSKLNEKVKFAASLTSTKNIVKSGKTLIESIKVLKDVLLKNANVNYVFVTEKSFNKNREFFENSNLVVYETTSEILKKLTSTVTSDEVLAVVDLPKQKQFNANKFLVLDNVQDPNNLGAIIRSACAFNFNNIVLIGGVNPYSTKVTRCSMGNNFNVNFFNITLEELTKLVKIKNASLYCLHMEGENIYNITSKPNNFGLVLGSEGQGVSNELKNLCNSNLKIPMQNNVESLNVAVSASIVMSYLNNI